MSWFEDGYTRLVELDTSGHSQSLEAIHLRDQLREAAHAAFMKTIAPSFRRADGSYPEWIAKESTTLDAVWDGDV